MATIVYLDQDLSPCWEPLEAPLCEPILVLRRDERQFIRSSRQAWRLWLPSIFPDLVQRIIMVDGEYFHVVHKPARDYLKFQAEYIGHFVTKDEALVISIMSM